MTKVKHDLSDSAPNALRPCKQLSIADSVGYNIIHRRLKKLLRYI